MKCLAEKKERDGRCGVNLVANYGFAERLEFSRGINEEIDIDVLRNYIDGCVSIEKTNVELDKMGIDYIATLRNGAEIKIDAKTRSKGCSIWWRDGPELALEIWSVIPTKYNAGKVGWTLDEKKEVDLIFFKFDLVDTDKLYLIPYQLLRMVFRRNYYTWIKRYKIDTQTSGGWQSKCVFVPARIVMSKILETMEFGQKAI